MTPAGAGTVAGPAPARPSCSVRFPWWRVETPPDESQESSHAGPAADRPGIERFEGAPTRRRQESVTDTVRASGEQVEPTCRAENRLGPLDERDVDHPAVHQERTHAADLGAPRGLDHAARRRDLGVGRPEHRVRERDLARVNAGLPEVAE